MRLLRRTLYISAAIIALTTCLPVHAQKRIEDRFGNVNGVRLHYLIAGKDNPVILLHGYAENSHRWRPLMVEWEKSHTGIAPALLGFGRPPKPMNGYDKK